MADEIKVGARHSAADQNLIQQIHDCALSLGAQSPGDEPSGMPMTGEMPMVSMMKALRPDALVFSGNAVKALGNGKVGGYLVLFGSADQTDLTGDYFTKATDFGGAVSSPVLWQHGMDPAIGISPVGAGTLKMDDIGVWIEAQLNMRSAYEKAVYGMAETHSLGWSSGTAAHLVKRETDAGGKASRITSWPLGLDASLTPTPAEPRTRALPLKSLTPTQTLQALLQASGEDATKGNAGSGAGPTLNFPTEGQIMSDTIETKVDALSAQVSTLVAALAAATKAEAKAAAAAPGYDIPGVTVKDVKVTDVQKKPFKNLGEFLFAVRANDQRNIDTETYNRLHAHQAEALKATGLNEAVGSEGGFLIGSSEVKPMVERMYTTGEILKRVTRNPVGPNSNGMRLFGIDETSRANGSRFGGVLGYWLAEGATKIASKPTFKELNLKLNKVAALIYATDEMLQDSTYLQGVIERVAPLELQFQVEDAIINGNGVGKPLGILASGALISATKDAAQVAATATIGNLSAIWGRLYAGGYKDAAIFVNQAVLPSLFAILATSVSTSGANLLQPPLPGADPYFTFFGRPIIPVEYLPALGTAGDILGFEPSQYQLIDKGGIQEASSIHVQFLTDETVFRFVYRVDGAPVWTTALTPYKGTLTTSPYVTVETRA